MAKEKDDKWDDRRIDDVVKNKPEELRESQEDQKSLGEDRQRRDEDDRGIDRKSRE